MKYLCLYALFAGCALGQCPKFDSTDPWSQICNSPILVKALCAPSYVPSQFNAVYIAAANAANPQKTPGLLSADLDLTLLASRAAMLHDLHGLQVINSPWCADCLVDGWNGYDYEYQPYTSDTFDLLRNLKRAIKDAVIMISLNRDHCK